MEESRDTIDNIKNAETAINQDPPAAEPERQQYFMERAKGQLAELSRRLGRPLTCCINTFGCQMNARDSEKLLGILETIGYQAVESEKADFVLFNTCTVRENANLRVYGRLGQLGAYKKTHPDMMIALCGCMMQEEEVVEKIRKSYRYVDLIFGTHNIFKLAELVSLCLERRTQGGQKQGKTKMVVDVWKDTDQIVEDLPVERKFPFKSGVNIMFGCNNFCSYCIVPYVRGRERSRRPGEIIGEIKNLVEDGVVEVMLLGQNVNSYGKSLSNNVTFVDLLKMVNEIDGIERIRFMTSHPKDFSKELAYAYRDLDKLKNFLHLPVQTGSSKVLRDMNRHYTKEDYIKKIDMVKEIVPEIALSTDLMVGFPTETEEDFKDTLDLCKYVEYDTSFTFIYSMREGTKAYEMEQVPEEIKHDRFDRLLDVIYPIQLRKNENEIGKVRKVLVESTSKSNDNKLSGRTDEFKLVNFDGDKDLIGKIVDVKITDANTFSLKGELVEKR